MRLFGTFAATPLVLGLFLGCGGERQKASEESPAATGTAETAAEAVAPTSDIVHAAPPAANAQAAAPPQPVARRTGSVQRLVEDAELIFEGEVVEIRYKFSEPPQRLPHTFVTFRIEPPPIKGSATDGDHITLRFLGGPEGNNRFLVLSHHPTFDVGDHGFLFVRGNQQQECPLVGCSWGRYRVIDDKLYSDEGHAIVPLGDDIARGPYRRLEAVETWTIDGVEFRNEGPEPPAPPPQGPGPQFGPPLLGKDFRQLLDHLVGAPMLPPSVDSADPDEGFSYDDGGATAPAVAPPALPLSPPQPPPADEQDELDALEANDGNPVLGPPGAPVPVP